MANRLIERYKVVFVPDKVEILVSKNTTILQAAIEAGIWY
jgi:hypothetical protein